ACQVHWRVGNGVSVRVVEETYFPFEEAVTFRVMPEREVAFPLLLRVPDWANGVTMTLNGVLVETVPGRRLIEISRNWKEGDTLAISFGAAVRASRWVENSVAIE